MKIVLDNIKQDNIIFFDLEYDRNSLVQLASLILSRCEPNVFELRRSINVYVKPNHSLSRFFIGYTGITDDFLCDNGVDLTVARTLVNQVMLDFDLENTLWISHGVRNDLGVMRNNGIDIEPPHQYCTYTKAKELLNRGNHLTAKEIATEDGYYAFNEHNAYADAFTTMHAFCFLNNLENKEYYMRLYNADKINIVYVPEHKVVEKNIKIEIPNVLQLSFTDYTAAIRASLIPALKSAEENTIFNIDFVTNDILEEDDIDQFYLVTMAEFTKALVIGGPRDRERRLSMLNSGLNINYNNLMTIVNNETRINCFNVKFRHGDTVLFFVN